MEVQNSIPTLSLHNFLWEIYFFNFIVITFCYLVEINITKIMYTKVLCIVITFCCLVEINITKIMYTKVLCILKKPVLTFRSLL
jgi:hypothetical protein